MRNALWSAGTRRLRRGHRCGDRRRAQARADGVNTSQLSAPTPLRSGGPMRKTIIVDDSDSDEDEHRQPHAESAAGTYGGHVRKARRLGPQSPPSVCCPPTRLSPASSPHRAAAPDARRAIHDPRHGGRRPSAERQLVCHQHRAAAPDARRAVHDPRHRPRTTRTTKETTVVGQAHTCRRCEEREERRENREKRREEGRRRKRREDPHLWIVSQEVAK